MRKLILAAFVLAIVTADADAQLFKRRGGGSCANGSCSAPAQVAPAVQAAKPMPKPTTPADPVVQDVQADDSGRRGGRLRDFIKRILHR